MLSDSCSIENCDNESVRTLSKARIMEAAKKLGLNLETKRGGRIRRAPLCKEHYKQIKKELKKQEKFERMRYGR